MERASDDLRAQITEQNKEIRDCESELKELKTQLHESQETVGEMEVKLSNRDATILDLESNISSMTKVVDSKESELAQYKRNLAETENQLQVTKISMTHSHDPDSQTDGRRASSLYMSMAHNLFFVWCPVETMCYVRLDDRESANGARGTSGSLC